MADFDHRQNSVHLPRASHVILLLLVLAGCGGDLAPQATTPGMIQPPSGDPAASAASFSLSVTEDRVTVVEGSRGIEVAVEILRSGQHTASVNLNAVSIESVAQGWTLRFDRARIDADGTQAMLSIALPVGQAPRLPGTETIRITATDGVTERVRDVQVELTPVSAPDVYLLIGQSNMVGFSEPGSRQAGLGGLDEPVDRILQLNVTGNDVQNFANADDFVNLDRIAGLPRLVRAEDPLHLGYNPAIDGKEGDYIGLGLSFAKAALPATASTIVLVPAAWSGTGFCRGSRDELSWNTGPMSQPEFGGRSLFDRAVARTNLVLQESGGILRGILWHQGESDSGDPVCAAGYAANLQRLAAALRSSIQPDGRGSAARGATSDVPFIVGTMSRGSDERGSFAEFDDTKLLIDGTHRNIETLVPHSGVSLHDDLVPPAYPCGASSCIHFGAAAEREMGQRYFQALQSVLAR